MWSVLTICFHLPHEHDVDDDGDDCSDGGADDQGGADDDEDDNDSDDDYDGCAEKKFQTVITSYNLLLSSIFPPKLTSRYMEEQAKTLGHKRKLLKTFPLALPLFLFKLF